MKRIRALFPIPITLFVILFITVISLVGCSNADSQSQGMTFVEQRPVEPNVVAPDFIMPWHGEAGSGQLSDLRGQVVLLNFWASWCPPCKRELPDLVALHTAYADSGFTVLGALVNSSPQEVDQVVAQYRIPYQSVTANDTLAAYWQVESIPTTYLIDRNGIVRYRYVGARDRRTFERDILRMLSSR